MNPNKYQEAWDNRPEGCTCPPPSSSIIVACKIHCKCMENGRSRYDPMIDGRCHRCRKYPLYV